MPYYNTHQFLHICDGHRIAIAIDGNVPGGFVLDIGHKCQTDCLVHIFIGDTNMVEQLLQMSLVFLAMVGDVHNICSFIVIFAFKFDNLIIAMCHYHIVYHECFS